MPSKKAIVVGAGIGGLATAIRLAVKGYQVDVFEKNSVAGGKMYLIEKNGYRFDAGPSLFTQPTNIEELFSLAGEDIHAYFAYEQVPLACTYFFENGKKVKAFADRNAFAQSMQEQVGEPRENTIAYLRDAEQVYEKVGNIFLNHSLHKASTWLHPRIMDAMKTIKLPYLLDTLNGFNERRFKTEEATQIFNRFATYNGSNPFRAPGMLSLIPHLEHNQGTFYPKGGLVSVPRALVALAEKKGVRFHLNSQVQRILTGSNRVKGVIADDQVHEADIVVSNVDAYYTYKNLLQDGPAATKVLKNERSSSAFIFYWGINREFDAMHLHNIFFSSNYRAEFEHLFRHKRFYEDPTVYINITSKMEGGQAPPGKENWFVMVNAPARTDTDWPAETEKLRKAVLGKISRLLAAEVEGHIEVEEVLSPQGIQTRTDSYLGSLYGTSSNSRWAAFLRQPNFSSRYKGLYFTGGSVHPGGGIPLCLKSAKIVAELVP